MNSRTKYILRCASLIVLGTSMLFIKDFITFEPLKVGLVGLGVGLSLTGAISIVFIDALQKEEKE